ncbi:hypothetical protein QBC35DRAFT_517075 [Podospora australis]|uniref:Methyltransferase type 11 domain-containing protein n=1 Tax=Podospora australis TaxID=1536484 RepID=A0AAN7AGR6_9PEZI|nr:hypothetical protein QBC35DRAFT_517075 [Podospora australis]
MASRRPGPRAPAWSGDIRFRNPGAQSEPPQEELMSNSSWHSRRGPEVNPQQQSRAIPQSKISSRLPQYLAHRRPSEGQPEAPRLGQQPPFRASVGSPGALGIADLTKPGLLVSATSRLPAPGSRPRNVLRRKHSGLTQDSNTRRNDSVDDSTGTSSTDSNSRLLASPDSILDRELTQSPMEIRVAHQVELPRTSAHTVTIYPELDRYRFVPARDDSLRFEVPHRLATHDLPPPTPLFSGNSSQVSGSPSTRWSESPGPGPYSRDTTPTSASSQSPGLVVPLRFPPSGGRIRPADPVLTRPPVTRRRTGSVSNEVDSVSADPHGLAVVRELSTSSSSNSTVRAGGDGKEKEKKKNKKNRELSPLPPSPPPRKSSSHKTKSSRDEGQSPLKLAREADQPRAVSPSPAKPSSYSHTQPVQAAQPVTSPKPTPPARPSRDGTLDLQVPLGQPIPVIHSNLSSTSLSNRRHSGLLAPSPVNRPALSSSLPSDQPSYLSRRPPAREPTPAPRSATFGDVPVSSKPDSVRTTRTPSPGVSAFKSRFPIFGRRTKTIPEPSQPEKKDKPTRKGPAAGTGHEGYGKLGATRRRSSSTNTSRVIPGTMSSQESPVTDSFLTDRMAPVIIAGGEIIENRNTSTELGRAESNLSFRRPSIESGHSSQVSLSSRDASRNTLWPSPFPRGVTQTPSLRSRRPSDSSDSEAAVVKPTLALRRSMQRLKAGEQQPPRLPKPIVTRPEVVSPSMTSFDASIMSDDSIFDPSMESAMARPAGPTSSTTLHGPKKLIKRARSPRKWNFFSRSQSQPAAEKKVDTSTAVAATVEVVQTKPVAFYTLMDSSDQEDASTPDLQEVLREAAIANPSATQTPMPTAERRPSIPREPTPQATVRPNPIAHQRPVAPKRAVTSPMRLFPSPAAKPVVSTPKATVSLTDKPAMPPPRQPPPRPSRLPQVGRIPKVVKARAEQISPKSFSRPFHRLSVQMPPPRTVLQDVDSVAMGPTPPGPTPPEASTPDITQTDSTDDSSRANSTLIYGIPRLLPADPKRSDLEFLSFSPRKNSQATTISSCSSGGLLKFADSTTAVVPAPNAPLAEDEIWDEYNDLLGEDTPRFSTFGEKTWSKSSKPPCLERSLFGNGVPIESALESPTLSPPPLPSLVQALRAGMEHTSSSVYSTKMAEDVRRMLEAAEPTSQISIQPLAQQARQSDASCSSQSSEEVTPLSQVNLRVGSMTVSKWLTFGHVLFSPIRDELLPVVGSLKRPSILVIDGLGNDDWSFYAAETYPSATFFNLSPRAPLPPNRQSSTAMPLSPPNHHQTQYLSHLDKFPFGPQSFTSVVYRFPAAAPESHYRNIISEARRVLKPGGFLELSILDVDLNNMGNRGRRAVRRIKERIHTRAPDTCLGSTSDLILRLIGRKGFTDLKTCRVGVPVASVTPRSSAGNRVSIESVNKGKNKDERSLPEIMSEQGPVADKSITEMVAKVGRWWYSRCYESAATPGVGPESRASMWRDKTLLKECGEWGTSLKLMVCHARVPDGRTRVASI